MKKRVSRRNQNEEDPIQEEMLRMTRNVEKLRNLKKEEQSLMNSYPVLPIFPTHSGKELCENTRRIKLGKKP